MEGKTFAVVDSEGYVDNYGCVVKLIALNTFKIEEDNQCEIYNSVRHILNTATYSYYAPKKYKYCELLTRVGWQDTKFKNYDYMHPADSIDEIRSICASTDYIFSKGVDLENCLLNGAYVNGVTVSKPNTLFDIIDLNSMGIDPFDEYIMKKQKKVCVQKDPTKAVARPIYDRSMVPLTWLSNAKQRKYAKMECYLPAHDPAMEIAYFGNEIEKYYGWNTPRISDEARKLCNLHCSNLLNYKCI